MQSLFQQIVPELAKFVGLALSLLFFVIGSMVRSWIQRRLSAQDMADLSNAAKIAVAAAQQSIVSALKDPNHSGEWTEQAAVKVRHDVAQQIRLTASVAIDGLRRYGMSEIAVATLIDQLIESHVLAEKSNSGALGNALLSLLRTSPADRTVPKPEEAQADEKPISSGASQ